MTARGSLPHKDGSRADRQIKRGEVRDMLRGHTWFHPLTYRCYASEGLSDTNHIIGTVIGDTPELLHNSKLVLQKKHVDSLDMRHVLK